MRLIDKDALKETIEFHPTSVSVCMTVAEAKGQTEFKNRCLDDIDNAPTIPAIPLEWLEKRRKNLILAAIVHSTVYGDNSVELCHAVNVVLDMWQKEQEAR